MRTIEVDERTAVKFSGRHRGINWEVVAHNFRDEPRRTYDQRELWATYIYLTEEQHEKYKSKIYDLPWNGSPTLYHRLSVFHVDWSNDTRKRDWAKDAEKPYYKIGDDFSHSWDMERADMLDRGYLSRHIKRVIDEMVGEETPE